MGAYDVPEQTRPETVRTPSIWQSLMRNFGRIAMKTTIGRMAKIPWRKSFSA